MSEDPSRYVCPNCSADMDGRKCKILCPRCGYFESCSDLEPAPPFSLASAPPAISSTSATTSSAPSKPIRPR